MSLMFLCKHHNTKFSIGSYCEFWKANEIIKKNIGSGTSTLRMCENCLHMPEYEEYINKIFNV